MKADGLYYKQNLKQEHATCSLRFYARPPFLVTSATFKLIAYHYHLINDRSFASNVFTMRGGHGTAGFFSSTIFQYAFSQTIISHFVLV